MKKRILMAMVSVALPGLIALSATSPARADDYCEQNCTDTPGHPSWPGQLMQTWDTPGTYGGWTNDPLLCDPTTQQCRIVSQP